jgi:glycopeptide antibiotics resistance protein
MLNTLLTKLLEPVILWWRPLCFLQFLILLALFSYLGLTPSPEKSVPMFNDKLMHCSGYFIAAGSMSFALPLWQLWQRASFLIVFSIGIEIGQHFMPPRSFDFLDIVANSSGVLVGLLLVGLLAKKLSWFQQLLHWQIVIAQPQQPD